MTDNSTRGISAVSETDYEHYPRTDPNLEAMQAEEDLLMEMALRPSKGKSMEVG